MTEKCTDHRREATSTITLMGTVFYHCDECTAIWQAMQARNARNARTASRRSFAAYSRQVEQYSRRGW